MKSNTGVLAFLRGLFWVAVATPIVFWVISSDFRSFADLETDFITYFLGVLVIGSVVRFAGERLLRRFWPSALGIQSNLVRCTVQSIGMGFFIVLVLAGSIHLHSPELWKYSVWLTSHDIFCVHRAIFVALLVRSRLTSKRNP